MAKVESSSSEEPLKSGVRHCAEMGRTHQLGVFGQNTPRVTRPGGRPFAEAALDFHARNAERKHPFFGVDGDGIAILDNGEGPACVSFGGNMPHNKAMAAARKAAIS